MRVVLLAILLAGCAEGGRAIGPCTVVYFETEQASLSSTPIPHQGGLVRDGTRYYVQLEALIRGYAPSEVFCWGSPTAKDYTKLLRGRLCASEGIRRNPYTFRGALAYELDRALREAGLFSSLPTKTWPSCSTVAADEWTNMLYIMIETFADKKL